MSTLLKHFWAHFQNTYALNHRQGLCIQADINQSYRVLEDFLHQLPLQSIKLSSYLYVASQTQELHLKKIYLNTEQYQNISPRSPLYTQSLPKYNHIRWKDTQEYLGKDESLLVVDLYEGIHPDVLASLVGCLQAGGILVVLMPQKTPLHSVLQDHLQIWPHDHQKSNRYWSRFWQSFTSDYWYRLQYVKETQQWISSYPQSESSFQNPTSMPQQKTSTSKRTYQEIPTLMANQLHRLIKTEAQKSVIKAMITSQHRQAFSSVIVTAHRGRGKSSAVGLGIVALLLSGTHEVHVTSLYPQATHAIFKHIVIALECLDIQYQAEDVFPMLATPIQTVDDRDSQHSKSSVSHHQRSQLRPNIRCIWGSVQWVSVQEIWHGKVKVNTLCVDEAATLPLPFLKHLLRYKPKLTLSTTIHGYEGTGKGFSLRFRPALQKKVKKLYEIQMHTPIRWASGDLLEPWSFHALLLDLQLQFYPLDIKAEECTYHIWDRDQLIQQEDTLRSIFALLLNAHYKTQPSDLWRILDAHNLSIHTLSFQNKIISAAIVSQEGLLNTQQAAQLYEGSIRPRGQLLAANLSIHLNDELSSCLHLARIVRIATLPKVQSKQLGSMLLTHIKAWSQQQKIDLLCSSFGIQNRLITFWSRNQFTPLRIAVRASQMSGEHSLLVAYPLGNAGQQTMQRITQHTVADFLAQCHSSLHYLDPLLIEQLLPLFDHHPQTYSTLHLSEYEWRKLASVIYAGRPYELIIRSAHQLARHALHQYCDMFKMNQLHQESCPYIKLSLPLRKLLLMKVLQSRGWMAICHELQLASPSIVMKGLNAALAHLFQAYATSEMKAWASRFPRYYQDFKLDSRLS